MTKIRGTKNGTGSYKRKPMDYGCPECNEKGVPSKMKFNYNEAICLDCGVIYSNDEYYDYLVKIGAKIRG